MFSVWSRFVKRSVIIVLLYFLLLFKACVFAKRRGGYVLETFVLWTIPIWHLQIWMKTWCRERDFGKLIVRPGWMNVPRNPSCFCLTMLLFDNYMILVACSIATISSNIENERLSLYVLQQLMISMIIWPNLKVKHWILAGMCSNSYTRFIEIWASVTSLRRCQ